MPRTPEQYQEIREERKKLIMDTALELFATTGYYGTSINEIAKHAKISKGLLYNYFSGKEELVIEIMKNGFSELIASFDPNHDGVLTKAEMRHFIKESVKTVDINAHFWRLYFAVISQPIVNKVAFGEIMEMAMPIFNILTDYFQKEGYKNPEAEARMIAAMLDGITLNYVYDPDTFPINDILERLFDIYKLNDN